MGRSDLEHLSKEELIELVLRLQRPEKNSRTSSKPSSTDRKERREQAKPRSISGLRRRRLQGDGDLPQWLLVLSLKVTGMSIRSVLGRVSQTRQDTDQSRRALLPALLAAPAAGAALAAATVAQAQAPALAPGPRYAQFRLDPRAFGAEMDGVTNDTVAIRACLSRARVLASVSSSATAFHAARIVVDFSGGRCAIGSPIVLDNDAHIVLDNPSWTAIGAWDTTRSMLEIKGTNAYPASAHVVVNNPRLDPNKLCRWMLIQNAPRTYVENLVIVGFLGVGLTLGANTWLTRISGGSIHEWDSGDMANLTDPTKRVGTGVQLLTGCGDISVDIDVGWCKVCIDNGGTGPVRFSGHWYCSSNTVAIEGDVFVHRLGAISFLDRCYLDTGWVRYYGGPLVISDSSFFFHLPSVTPATLTGYIAAVASVAGQYSTLEMQNPQRSSRTKPWFVVDETNGTWANISAPMKASGYSLFATVDPPLFKPAVAGIIGGRFDATGAQCQVQASDVATTTPPYWGSAGNDWVAGAGGTEFMRCAANRDFINFAVTRLSIGNVQVVAGRKTGWGTPAGTLTRTALDPTTATLPQAVQQVNALITDLRAHGLIGT